MKLNKTKDSLTWMQGMRLSYDGVTRQIDLWLNELLNTTKRQYGKYTVFGIIIEAFKQLATLIFAHIVIGTKEHNIITAEQTAAVRGLAQLACYKSVSACEAVGKVALTFNSTAVQVVGPTIFVKRYAKLKCKENSLLYFLDMTTDYTQLLLNDDTISKSFEFVCRQGEHKQQQFIADAVPMQAFTLVERNSLISERSIVVTVTDSTNDSNNIWSKYEGFAEMNRSTEGYIVQWSFDGKLQLIFGNGVTGKMPAKNAVINVDYIACDGYDGNVLVQNNVTFEFVDGLFDANTTSINPKDSMSISHLVDIVGGYNGDDIQTIRNNAGSINRSLVLHSAESIRAYMNRYGQYSIVDIWSNTETQTIHVIAVPNITDKFVNAGNIVYDYWSLPLAEFTLSNADKEYLQNAIHANKDYVLLTDVSFDTVKLEYYQCLILCNKTSLLQNNEDIKLSILNVMTTYIESSWSANKQFISRSAAISLIEQLGIVQSIDVKFIGNDEHIDALGNISSTDKSIMPVIRSTSSIDVNMSIKVLIESNGQYVEI